MMGKNHARMGLALGLGIGMTVGLSPESLTIGVVLASGFSVFSDLDHPDSGVSRCMGLLSRSMAKGISWMAGGHRNGTHSFFGAAVFTLIGFGATAIYAEDSGLLAIGGGIAAALVMAGWLVAKWLNRGRRPGRAYARRWHGWIAGGVLVMLGAAMAFAGHLFGRTAGAWMLGFLMALSLAALLRAWLPIKRMLERVKIACGLLDDVLPFLIAWALISSGIDLTVVPYALTAGILIHIAGDAPTVQGCPLGWPRSQRNVGPPWRFTTNSGAERWLGRGFLVVTGGLLLLYLQVPQSLLALN
jgi:membrane-bound metal-dependent hydrolase YbcI (DUF457 family)